MTNETTTQESYLTDYAYKTVRVKAKQLHRRPEFGDCDQEDIEQDLLLYLLTKANCFDDSRSTLNTFIDRIVESGVRELIRNRKRQKRNPDLQDIAIESFENPMDTVDGSFANLGDELSTDDLQRRTGNVLSCPTEEVDRKDALANAMGTLPELYRRICESLMTSTDKETMKQLGLSRREFEHARRQIAEHLESYDATKI